MKKVVMIRCGHKQPRTEQNPSLPTIITFSRRSGFGFLFFSAASGDTFHLRGLTALCYFGQFSKQHFSYENKMYFWSVNMNLERHGAKKPAW